MDLYNSTSGEWSTDQLSKFRDSLEATSVGNVAIFAGGMGGNCSFALCDGGFVSGLLCVDDACVRRVVVVVVYALQQVAV